MTEDHHLPIKELKKNFSKLISLPNTQTETISIIKDNIDTLTWDIQEKINENGENKTSEKDIRKQEYIDSRLLPATILFATIYSLQLSDEYDSIYSLSDPSDGTNGSYSPTQGDNGSLSDSGGGCFC